jgi:hypothetical protein
MDRERKIKPHISHDNIERCPICKEYLLHNQIKNHKCPNQFKGVKEIPVYFFYQTSDGDENKAVIAKGIDGILYKFVKCRNPNLSKILSNKYFNKTDESYHEDRKDDKLTEPKKATA